MSTDRERHVWTDDDRERFGARSWLCPRRIIEGGIWAQLWNAGGTRGACTSVLPVLALHSWPKRGRGTPAWSEWAHIGRRRIAGLAGIDTKTATIGLSGLGAAGLLESVQVRAPDRRGGYRTRIRLAGRLFAADDEPSGRVHGNLIAGGTWAMLPSAAARHLHVVVAAMDAIGHEDAYVQRITNDANDSGSSSFPWDGFWEQGDEDEQQPIARWLDTQRAGTPMSVSDISEWSGLSRRTVVDVLPQLLAPIYGAEGPAFGPVKRGICDDGRSHWYAIDRRASTWFWPPKVLNDPAAVARARARHWPDTRSRWMPSVGGGGRWHYWVHEGAQWTTRCGHGYQPQFARNGKKRAERDTCKRCRKLVQ